MRRTLTLLSIVVIAGAWILGGSTVAALREKAVDRAWAETGLPMDGITTRYRKAGPSEAALEIEAVAAGIGIEIAPHEDLTRVRPALADVLAFDGLGLPKFVEPQVRSDDDTIQPAPQNIADFLAARVDRIAAIKRAALRGTVTWEMDLGRHFYLPGQALKGVRQLIALLLADALERARLGNSAVALESLDAAWRIGEGLRGRPQLMFQVLGFAMDQQMLGALRKIPGVSSEWPARIREHDAITSLLQSFQAEAWILSDLVQHTHRSPFSVTGTVAERWLRAPLDRPYLRLSAADYSDVLRQAVAELKAQDPCLLNRVAFESTVKGRMWGWNTLGRRSFSNFPLLWRQAVHRALEAELTEKVLLARQHRPRADSLSSAICSELTWTWQTIPGGSLIAISKDLFGDMGVRNAPLRFAIKQRTSAKGPDQN